MGNIFHGIKINRRNKVCVGVGVGVGVCVCGCMHVLNHQVVCNTLQLQTVASQAPLSMGFFRQIYWSELSCSPPRDLPNPGIESESPTLAADSLPLSHQGSRK